MKRCYIDTNVLLEYKTTVQSKISRAEQLIIDLMLEEIEIVISPLIIDEFVYIILKSLEAKDKRIVLKVGLLEILSLPNLKIVNPPTTKASQIRVLNYIDKFNMQPRDAYHLLTALHNKADYIATFDKDFDKVFEAKLIKRFKGL